MRLQQCKRRPPTGCSRLSHSLEIGHRSPLEIGGAKTMARALELDITKLVLAGLPFSVSVKSPRQQSSCMICQVPGASYGTVVGADGRTSSCSGPPNFSTSPGRHQLTAHDMIVFMLDSSGGNTPLSLTRYYVDCQRSVGHNL